MSGVLQSGNIVPGHGAAWVSDGVIGDAGNMPYSQRVLASFLSANFNDTGDQPLPLPARLQAFQLTGIVIANASVSLTAAVGGFYPQASQAGTPIVAASQTYAALTASTLLMSATLSSYAQQQRFSRTQLPDWAVYFSLSTPQGSVAIADIYLIGIELG